MLLLLLLFKLISSYVMYDLNIKAEWNRPVYISSQIEQPHIDRIHDAIYRYNIYLTTNNYLLPIINPITTTIDKSKNHIRIQYNDDTNFNYKAYTTMFSRLHDDNTFKLENTIIKFNKILSDELLVCVIMHELGHSMGLGHSTVIPSIMNFTIYIIDNIIQQPMEKCYLEIDDIMGLISL